jgi:hypothetical protein
VDTAHIHSEHSTSRPVAAAGDMLSEASAMQQVGGDEGLTPSTRCAQESNRVAELLSQLPPDLDVEGMVEQCWAAAMGTAHNSQRQALRAQSSQVDSFLAPGSAPGRQTAAAARKASFFSAIQSKLARLPQAGGADGGGGDVEITPGNLAPQDVAGLRYSGEALRRRGAR